MKLKLSNCQTYFLGLSLLLFFFMSETSFADMAQSKGMNSLEMRAVATTNITTSEIVAYYKAEQRVGQLTSNQSKVLKLTELAKEVFGVKEFYLIGTYNNPTVKVKAVGLAEISHAIQSAIWKKDKWDQPISLLDKKKITETAYLIKKSLGDDAYTKAWFIYQQGDKKQSKDLLLNSFENSYAETMKLTQIGFEDSHPLQHAEAISKVLSTMCTDEENKSRAVKLQKMRLHVSNLPNMQMMT